MKSSWERPHRKRQKNVKIFVTFVTVVVTIILIPLLIWIMANTAKYLSYEWFYEDMVKETIQEMVKDSALK